MLLRELATAVVQAADMLDGGDTAAALTAADALCATAAQARRLIKSAATGRKPRGTAGPVARPGQLRDLVAAHLSGHPDTDFSPHQIGRVLGRSSGAVANALDRLTALGQAQLTSESPAATATRPRPAPPPPTAPPDRARSARAQGRLTRRPGSSLPARTLAKGETSCPAEAEHASATPHPRPVTPGARGPRRAAAPSHRRPGRADHRAVRAARARDLPGLRGQLAAWLDGGVPVLPDDGPGGGPVPSAASLAAGTAQVARQERLQVTGDPTPPSSPR